MAKHASIIFITGGVRSGKSRFAEKLAGEQSKIKRFGQLHYIAAMQPSDEEMKQRIRIHQDDRFHSSLAWNTWEKPTSIGDLAGNFNENDVVLLDCLTTWLNNELFFEEDGWKDDAFLSELFKKIWNGLMTISQNVNTFIIVSNEVFYEPIDFNDLVFVYSSLLGNLHQKIVAKARLAYLVEMGIPVVMKGDVG